MEAIILAGGFGTRLRAAIQDVPKPMAPIRGKPFLEYLLHYLSGYKISRFVLCTGYKHEVIEHYFGAAFKGIPITYSVETEPLGTGGALQRALSLIEGPHSIVLNGDSFFEVDIDQLVQTHLAANADFTLALKKMFNFDRYGTVKREGERIVSFEEKQFCSEGEINGGVYAIKKKSLVGCNLPDKYSLEKDFLEKYISELCFCAKTFDGYFIDIGIPEDFERAQRELKAI